MNFLASTNAGLEEAIARAVPQTDAVWCGADAISEADFQGSNRGIPLTRFIHSLQNLSSAELDDAIGTIREHHPGQRIWLEATVRGNE